MWLRVKLPIGLNLDGLGDIRHGIGRGIEVRDPDCAHAVARRMVPVDRRSGLPLSLVDDQLVVVNPNPNAVVGIRHESILPNSEDAESPGCRSAELGIRGLFKSDFSKSNPNCRSSWHFGVQVVPTVLVG